MSSIHSCEWMPPIRHPERFALWSRDVRTLLEYFPRYVHAGRKERVFVAPLKLYAERNVKRVTLDLLEEYASLQFVDVLILPNQEEAYEHLVQQNEAQRQWDLVGELRTEGPIPLWGPDGHGEPVVTDTEVALTIGDDQGKHFFALDVDILLHGTDNVMPSFCFWYRGWSSDVVVQAALMRLSSYFPGLTVSSDAGPAEWWEASLLCQKLFGVAELPPDLFIRYHRNPPTFEAKELLRRVASGLPDCSSSLALDDSE